MIKRISHPFSSKDFNLEFCEESTIHQLFFWTSTVMCSLILVGYRFIALLERKMQCLPTRGEKNWMLFLYGTKWWFSHPLSSQCFRLLEYCEESAIERMFFWACRTLNSLILEDVGVIVLFWTVHGMSAIPGWEVELIVSVLKRLPLFLTPFLRRILQAVMPTWIPGQARNDKSRIFWREYGSAFVRLNFKRNVLSNSGGRS